MTKPTISKAHTQMNAIRSVLKEGPKTLSEIAKLLGVSSESVRYYVNRLIDLGHVRKAGEIGAQKAIVYEWALKPLPVYKPRPPEPKAEPDMAKPEKPMCTRAVPANSRAVLHYGPKPNPNTLTRWVGGNPFEKLRKHP